MEWYYILAICIAAAVALVCAALLALAALAYRIAFSERCDKNPLLTYFTAEHFGLIVSPVEVKKGTTTLRGGLYKAGAGDVGLIIFCHGMGAGHAAYMTEVAYFCKRGYTVLAMDNRGCDLSDGNGIKGMYSGAEAAIAAYDFAKSDERLKGMKTVFMGHSWGGYSALCAAAERKADGVVALSAPLSPAATISGGAAGILPKWLACALRPFAAVCDFFIFGVHSNKNAAVCAQKCGTPVLLVHGDGDGVVPFKNSAYAKAEGANITKYLAAGKAHNPYNTQNAEKLLAELSAKLASAKTMDDEQKKFFALFDYAAATEEDENVMREINSFIENL